MIAFHVTYFIGNQMVRRIVLGSSDDAVIRMILREDSRIESVKVRVVS